MNDIYIRKIIEALIIAFIIACLAISIKIITRKYDNFDIDVQIEEKINGNDEILNVEIDLNDK